MDSHFSCGWNFWHDSSKTQLFGIKTIYIISKLPNKFYNSCFSSKYQVNLANILLNNEQYMSNYLETELWFD